MNKKNKRKFTKSEMEAFTTREREIYGMGFEDGSRFTLSAMFSPIRTIKALEKKGFFRD